MARRRAEVGAPAGETRDRARCCRRLGWPRVCAVGVVTSVFERKRPRGSIMAIWVAGGALACGWPAEVTSPSDAGPEDSARSSGGIGESTAGACAGDLTPEVDSSSPECGAPGAAASLAARCGDGSCAPGESCDQCPRDCGSCRPALQLFASEPVVDAELAATDAVLGALEATLLSDLFSAQTRIDVAAYSLNRRSIVRALVLAAQRGVSVRVLVECENRYGADALVFEELKAGGVMVSDDKSSYLGLAPGCPGSSSGSMHHKFITVDEQVVWMGSTNFTWTGFNYNHNASLRIRSPAVAAAFGEEFGYLWNGSFGQDKPARPVLRFELGGPVLELAFSPAPEGPLSTSLELLGRVISGAKKDLRFAAFYLTHPDLVLALAQSSAAVSGVLDASGAASASSRHGDLCARGVPVVIENHPGKVHHKLLVADDSTGQGITIVGSANFTRSGLHENDEAIAVVADPAVGRAAVRLIENLLRAEENVGLACCAHSAEAFNEKSPRCGDLPCVCGDGLDNDHDGRLDLEDSGCELTFTCSGTQP